MISEIEIGQDAAHFPVLRWTETRGQHAAGGPGEVRVECRIAKHPRTGVLYFVVRGPKRRAPFEDGRPWEGLSSFGKKSAEQLYYTPAEIQTRRRLGQKSLGTQMFWSDGGQVIVADVRGALPLHVDDAEASETDLARLHFTLEEHFIIRRRGLIDAQCREAYRWPVDDERVGTYDPGRKGSARLTLTGAFEWLVAAVIVVGALGLVTWLVMPR